MPVTIPDAADACTVTWRGPRASCANAGVALATITMIALMNGRDMHPPKQFRKATAFGGERRDAATTDWKRLLEAMVGHRLNQVKPLICGMLHCRRGENSDHSRPPNPRFSRKS